MGAPRAGGVKGLQTSPVWPPVGIKFLAPADVEKSEKCLLRGTDGSRRCGGGATVDGQGPANIQWNKVLPPENNGAIPG